MKLQAWSTEPVVVEFPAHRAMGANSEIDVKHEVRVMRLHLPAQIGEGGLLNPIRCTCPRVVQPTTWIRVWHSPECPEIERDL